jgi:type I restriction enzyme S subunit
MPSESATRTEIIDLRLKDGLKSRYQESLVDLQNVYDALSQKAFKGEIDLSRVTLLVPTKDGKETREGKQV